MSPPVSAMNVQATSRPTPGDRGEQVDLVRPRGHRGLEVGVQVGDGLLGRGDPR
jgi:hypothetical protein